MAKHGEQPTIDDEQLQVSDGEDGCYWTRSPHPYRLFRCYPPSHPSPPQARYVSLTWSSALRERGNLYYSIVTFRFPAGTSKRDVEQACPSPFPVLSADGKSLVFIPSIDNIL